MPKPSTINGALERGLAFLAKQQAADGGFVSFSSPSQQPFQPVLEYRTTFVPALMLAALVGVDSPAASQLRTKLAGFLLMEQAANGSFNYWAKDAPEYTARPYPNDLDDTFCALSALWLHDHELVNERILAKAIKLLLATETAVGGPYRTWLVATDSPPVWLDVDLAVNANVAYFLSLVSQPLPNVMGLIDQALASGRLQSPYYPSAYSVAYYISRGYVGQQRAALLKAVRKLVPAATTALDLALSLAALGHLEAAGRQGRAVDRLLAMQAPDGSWPAAAFCLDPALKGQAYYNGAAALTTAFALEALSLYPPARRQPDTASASRRAASRHQATQTAVLALADQQCRPLASDLRQTTLRSLNKLANSSNGPEIISLPYRFNQSLLRPVTTTPDSFLENLGLANLYGWLAYTIYDDFLDEEGRPALLPAANVAMRNSLRCFSDALAAHRPFQSLVDQVFDAIDGANAWEVSHCRFGVQDGQLVVGTLPNYGNLAKLAERSLGHTLAPLAILSAAGLKASDPAFRQTRRALAHYLIVRQLNDDAHDWPEDLANGHITYVVGRLLTDLKIRPGQHDLTELLAKARRQFWHASLPAICREMRRHTKLSRQALDQAGLFKPDSPVAQLIDRLDMVITDTLAKQSQAENFLRQYSRKTVKL